MAGLSNLDLPRKVRLKSRLLAYSFELFDLPFILDKRTNPRIVLAHKIQNKPLSVLDVCIGTAIGSIAVARLNPQNEITGIDSSLEILTLAEEKIRKRHVENITLRQMSAEDMQFPDRSFDVVMISFGLHELGDDVIMTALKEMRRVLRRGGNLFVVDYARQGGRWINLLFSLYLRVFEPKNVFRFLECDWIKILQEFNFQITDVEPCLFAKVISATKNR